MKWKLWEKSLLVALAVLLAVNLTGLSAAGSDIPSRVLRLHVLANSDSDADQALKLKVRDRVLEVSADWMENAGTLSQAEAAARAHLPEIQKAAEKVIRENGSGQSVRVTFEDVWFPTRQYENVTLPAGVYRALRVVLGKGEGHNWWCVLFPSLCLPSSEPETALSDVLTQPELDLVTSPYRIRFQSIEWLESVQRWFSSLCS